MLRRVLILMIAVLLGSGFAVAAHPSSYHHTVATQESELHRTSDDVPQWEELGLRDILVSGTETIVVVPTTHSVRTAVSSRKVNHFAPALFNGDARNALSNALLRMERYEMPLALPTRAVDYYLYYIYCLQR